MSSKSEIIFDFDGVIANTFDVALQLSREMDGHPFTIDEYKNLFNGNLFEEAQRQSLPTFSTPSHRDNFSKIYGSRIGNHLLYPGMRDLIIDCSSFAPLHIVSSGGEAVIRNFLVGVDLEKSFNKILGYETEPSKVQKFKMLGVLPETADKFLFITDTLGDLKEAEQVGMPAIAVSWGYHDAARLDRGNPLFIAKTPRDLLVFIRSLQ